MLLNDLVVEITQAVLGEGVKNSFSSGNTCLRNETQQPLHVDATSVNGSTEVWPGTHMDTTRTFGEDIKLSPEDEARCREECRPLQPSVPAGSVLIRDMRLWHRGMPNLTDQPWPMIAMIHWPPW